MKILITGGAGYIGSHTAVEFINNGYEVVVVDDLSNSSKKAIDRVSEITNHQVPFYEIDLLDKEKLETVFKEHKFDAIVHFAGFKAVGESVKEPLKYYRNNLDSSLSMLEMVDKYDVKNFIFSSSATVYGSSGAPYKEDCETGRGITNPYGKTKYMIEEIIKDYSSQNPDKTLTILRYFNPIGAHESGLIGEDPKGIPNNLMPFITQVACGSRDKLSIFGNDYPTPDGTCIRDYIHVVDLAKGHLAAYKNAPTGLNIYNLGSGKGVSVLELVNTFIESCNVKVPFEFAPRRAGDLPEFYADPTKAAKELNWKVEKSIKDMCVDSWRWQSKNPNGYR